MTDPPLKPTKTLADVIERFKKRLDEEVPTLPKPTTDEAPPKPWNETDPQQDEGAT